jgi:hypothetical protein
MSDQAQIPASSNGDPDSETLDAEREAALTQELLRAQERHREGGPDSQPRLAEASPELAGA